MGKYVYVAKFEHFYHHYVYVVRSGKLTVYQML